MSQDLIKDENEKEQLKESIQEIKKIYMKETKNQVDEIEKEGFKFKNMIELNVYYKLLISIYDL